MSKTLSNILAFFLGLIIGILALAGGIVGGGYWLYKNATLNKAEQALNKDFGALDKFLTEDSILKAMSLEEIIKEAKSIPEQTVADFSQKYGITLPQNIAFIFNALGDVQIKNIGGSVNKLLETVQIGNFLGDDIYKNFDPNAPRPDNANPLLWEIRTYTIQGENSINKLADNLTIGKVESIFNITFPSLMQNVNRDAPISNIGAEIDALTMSQLIAEPDPNADHITKNLINKIRTMTDDQGNPYTLGNINELLSKLTSVLVISDIIEQPTGDSISDKVMRKLLVQNPSLSNLSNVMADIMNNLYIHEIIAEPQEGADQLTVSLINKLRYMTKDGVVVIPSEEGPAVEYYTLGEMDELLNSLFSTLEIKDVIFVDSAAEGVSHNILSHLVGNTRPASEGDSRTTWRINEIQQAVSSLTLTVLFPLNSFDESTESGRQQKALITLLTKDGDVTIDEIPEAVINAMRNATMLDFHYMGIIDLGENPESHMFANRKLSDFVI